MEEEQPGNADVSFFRKHGKSIKRLDGQPAGNGHAVYSGGGSEAAADLCGRSLGPPDGWILTTGAMKPLWMCRVVSVPQRFPSFRDHVRVKKKKKERM